MGRGWSWPRALVGACVWLATVLAALAREAEGTRVTWVTRRTDRALAHPHDLPGFGELARDAEALLGGSDQAVRWIGGAWLEGLEFNSATHRFRANLRIDEQTRLEEAEREPLLGDALVREPVVRHLAELGQERRHLVRRRAGGAQDAARRLWLRRASAPAASTSSAPSWS